jgi:nucleoside-triphosphatase THEP1
MDSKVHKIVLTGDPCAGKTTSLTKLRDKFMDSGFLVYYLPEVDMIYVEGSDFRN